MGDANDKVQMDETEEFKEVACERCGTVMYFTKGSLERNIASKGKFVCEACEREKELLDDIAEEREARRRAERPEPRKSDIFIMVIICGVAVFLGMQIWLLWPEKLSSLKFLPVLMIFIMVGLMISQLKRIINGEPPVWRRER